MASADAHLPIAEPGSERSADTRPADLDRLEWAVRELISVQKALRAENVRLRTSTDEARRQLEESRREQQARVAAVRGLEERLLFERQRRMDALKRIDDLVGLIEQLDPSLAAPSGGSR